MTQNQPLRSKHCRKCGERRSLDDYHFSKRDDNYIAICKICFRLQSKAWHFKNKEQVAARKRLWRLGRKEIERKRKRAYYIENKDRIRNTARRWRDKNKDKISLKSSEYYIKNKAAYRAKDAKRRAIELRAVPIWLSQEQIKQIANIYRDAPLGHEVDHIVPLNNPMVCGLHVPWNLQYLLMCENRAKGNRL